jgi:RNA 3'-phosphate cyclase
MIIIDGSYGEGGGQILRTSLSLSVILNRPVKIINIRAKRPNPGLKPQHLTCIRALTKISNAHVEGDKLNSQNLVFIPRECKGGNFLFNVASEMPSAGAVSLVAQALFLPLCRAKTLSKIVIKGGTHVAWSPPYHYLEEIFIYFMRIIGVQAKVNIRKWGWYPKGQGEIEIEIHPANKFSSLNLKNRGALKKLKLISVISNLPLSIAKRQAQKGEEILKKQGFSPVTQIKEVHSKGKGTFFFLIADFENSKAGFSNLGEIGKRAEKVAEEAVEEFLQFYKSNMCLDRYLTDQLIPYLALSHGESTITTSNLSEHTLTNIWVVEKFLPVKFHIEGRKGKPAKISVKGIGF